MKSFKSLVLALLVAAGLSLVVYAASPLEVTVSTVVPNGSTNKAADFTAAGYPQITGTPKIRKVWLSNDGAAERVGLWKNCTSSTTATLVWDGIVPSSTTASNSPGNLEVNWLPLGAAVASPCIHKGLNGSGTVKAHISYE